MGLDVTVYGNIKLSEKNSYDDDFDYAFRAFVIDKEWEFKIKKS